MLYRKKQMALFLIALLSLSYVQAETTKKVTYPPMHPPKGVDAASAKRGEYLVKLSDCLACHTTEDGKPFAGGLDLPTPFGTYYSPNITPDKETGIGKWSDEEFVRALKWGMGPHGKMYFPVFPYVYYNQFTDQEARDIRAYLASIPAVKQQNKPIDAPFVFRFRPANFFWNLMFFYPYTGSQKPVKEKSDAWNRGRYIVTGPGHCDMCHTPINPLGGLKRNLSLTGADTSGYYAPNLTATTLGNFSLEEVYRVFAFNELPGGGKVQGPMLEANQNSLQHLTKDDLYAIATYIKSLEARSAPKKATAGLPGAEPKVLDHYQTFCAGCHDMGSGGAPKFGDAGDWEDRIATGKETLYKTAIKGIGSMPAKGLCATCSDEDIHDLVDYMIRAVEGGGAAKTKEPKGPAPANATLERGAKVYQDACASCHAKGENGAPMTGSSEAWADRINQGFDHLIAYALDHDGAKDTICPDCSDTDLIAAVKYMAQVSQKGNDYALW